jgi:hypothetical protein
VFPSLQDALNKLTTFLVEGHTFEDFDAKQTKKLREINALWDTDVPNNIDNMPIKYMEELMGFPIGYTKRPTKSVDVRHKMVRISTQAPLQAA